VTGPATADLCRQAIQLLDAAIEKPPAELKAEVDVAECGVVAVRDALIERLRSGSNADTRSALDHVNAALSLVVGVEYPVGGLQRGMLEQARAALQATLDAAEARQ
jgi:hypothetical protein